MNNQDPNKNVVHPSELIKKEDNWVSNFNRNLALKITNGVGSMWSAYLFALLSIMSLPAILGELSPSLKADFPTWIINTSVITLIAWISQNFLQLVLLPIIMVGQNVIQQQQDAKTEADHNTLTYLANLQERQTEELKNQSLILEQLKSKIVN